MNIFIILLVFISAHCYGDIERRAAVDVGSGGTKVAIADVDTSTNKIVEVLFEASFSVPFQASLDKSSDGTFDNETRMLGVKCFQEIVELSATYEVKQISAIATSAFRKSNNAQKLVAEIAAETNIQVQVIPQREEGEIAFFSALANGDYNKDEVVVLDIGTGSIQMTATGGEDDLIVYMGENMGSVAFKNYIVDVIQENDLETNISPNPMNDSDLKFADSYARAFGRKAFPVIKEKIQEQGKVVGIGRLFYNSIRPIASENGIITRDALRSYIRMALNKSDAELDNPYAHVDVSNCILTLAIMKSLHIQEITPVETTTTRGLLISENYWK